MFIVNNPFVANVVLALTVKLVEVVEAVPAFKLIVVAGPVADLMVKSPPALETEAVPAVEASVAVPPSAPISCGVVTARLPVVTV